MTMLMFLKFSSAPPVTSYKTTRAITLTRFGYSDISYTYNSGFGRGSGPVHLNYLVCYGTEQRLTDCRSQTNTWSHYNDWGITCINDVPNEGDIKLYYNAYNPDYYRGMVQVWLYGQWGYIVSGYQWSMNDVQVVCRQLGRSGIDDLLYYYNYYYDNLPPLIMNVGCSGTESKLIDCTYDNVTTLYDRVAGAECSRTGACSYGDVRLTGGGTEREGRVEMCNYRSMWGSVCNSLWSPAAHSRVVCRSLGFNDKEGTADVYQGFTRDNNIPITADHVRCEGTEHSLKNCISFAHSYGCSHGNDIGVRCQPANCEDGEVKLLGDMEDEGLSLVCINRRWGTLCNSNTGANINTVCKQLGYDFGYTKYYAAGSKPRVGPVKLDYMQCSEDHNRVFDCSYILGNDSLSCSEPLGIRCYSAGCKDGEVRLVDGESEMKGRVEICFGRRWGTISSDGWTNTESAVVCNDLGYEPSGEDYSVRPATNSMPVYMKNVKCTGRELSLLECGYRRNLTHTSHLTDISVKCKNCEDGDLRLLGGNSDHHGLIWVCFNKRWGTVNADGWTDEDTRVVCRQLKFFTDGKYSTSLMKGIISAPIHMDNVGCHGTEDKLIECGYHTDTSEDSHSDDVWIDCSNTVSDPCKTNNTNNIINTMPPITQHNIGNEGNGSFEVGLILGIIILAAILFLSAAFVVVSIIIIKGNGSKKNLSGKVKYKKSSNGIMEDVTVRTNDPETDSQTYTKPPSPPPPLPTCKPSTTGNSTGSYQYLTFRTMEKESSYATLNEVAPRKNKDADGTVVKKAH